MRVWAPKRVTLRTLCTDRTFLASTVAVLAAPAIARGAAANVLKFVPQADLAVLDPIWTTTYQTRDHGFLVFDTLFGLDSNYRSQPQMAAGAATEDGGKTWRITLRPDLTFHDGTKVLARDCAASIKRWGARDGFGQALMAATDEISAPDDTTILFRLKAPFPLLPDALGKTPPSMCRDHAGASCRHRPVQAGHRDGRQRPVSLQGRRACSWLAGGLRTQPALRAASRGDAGGHGRAEDRAYGAHRVAHHPRPRHHRGRAADRGDRLVAGAGSGPACRCFAPRAA